MSDVRLRGLTAADLPAVDELLRAVEAVDRTDEHYNLADLEEEYADPLVDGERDWIGAFDGHDLVGATRILPRAVGEDSLVTYLEGCTHPAHRGRGVGTRLVATIMDRLAQRHRHLAPQFPALTRLGGLTDAQEQHDLLARAGFAPERYSFALGVQPLPEQSPGDLPGGLRIRRYQADTDVDALREVHNLVFRDHPGSSPWTAAEWHQWVVTSRNSRPELTYLVVDESDAIVAYVQVDEYDAVQETTGLREAWMARIGTVREQRGKGIASTLLRHVLEACRVEGFDRAGLDVDSLNPTGALGVYERAGFALEKHWTTYLHTDPPTA